MSADNHGLSRAEWVRRFRAQFLKRLGDDPGDATIEAELGSWPEADGDWRGEMPEDAADDCLSYWDADEAPQ